MMMRDESEEGFRVSLQFLNVKYYFKKLGKVT